METILLTFTDAEKAKALLIFLRTLDYVQVSGAENIDPLIITPNDPNADPWEMFGVMPDITLEEVRRKAWPEK